MEHEKIKVASKTYNACTKLIEENFGVEVNKSMKPKARFHLALSHLQAMIKNEENEENEEDRSLDDFSKNGIRAVFEAVATQILDEAKKARKSIFLTRTEFIRKVCDYMHGNCGMKRVERLCPAAQTGVFYVLNQHFRWLLRNFKNINHDGSSDPDSLIKFISDKKNPRKDGPNSCAAA